MNSNKTQNVRDLLVFSLLVAIGVVGRWGQPDWEFTPIAAATVFAGFYFSRAWVAVLVPLAIRAVSDMGLRAYDSTEVMIVTYAAMTLPVLFGRMLGRSQSTGQLLWRCGVCCLVPATIFFITTNFAVWAFESDYAKTPAGLVECYVQAVPFFRSMLAGDLFYLATLFGCWSLAGERGLRMQHAEERVS